LVTSRELADIVGDALGIPRETAQLHLKTIRAAGEISFKGYGRAAAAMTALDASRLIIAAAGSTFAKDSADVLKRFAKLRPISARTRITDPLEDFLAWRIEELSLGTPPIEHASAWPEWQKGFGSRRLAETALQLIDPIPISDKTAHLARYAIVRSIDHRGHPHVLVFGPDGERLERRGADAHDLLGRYSGHQLFQMRMVKREALIEIAAALKGIELSYGNAYGNTR